MHVKFLKIFDYEYNRLYKYKNIINTFLSVRMCLYVRQYGKQIKLLIRSSCLFKIHKIQE